MKTSNLILLILLTTCLFVVLSVPLMVRLKLDSGNYTQVDSDQTFEYDRLTFESVDVISIQNVALCTIVPSDSLMIDIERGDKKEFTTRLGRDSLVVRNDGSSERHLRIYVPQTIHIRAKDCNLLLKGTLSSLDSLNTEITLINSRAQVLPIFKDDRVQQYWARLALTGVDSSSAEISGAAIVSRLELKNLSKVKMGNHVFVDKMQTAFDVNKRVTSFSDHDGLTITSY
jgi:hypothetical protein